jgi:hypothetical protein
MLPAEILHNLHPPGMPLHCLHLKVGGIYMLLRNMNIKLGLCNGARFVLLKCSNPFVLKCQLIPQTQTDEPTVFFLPRINCTATEQYPFQFQRKQFPILPAFAMTINKSQGGTFDKVGIDLSTHVFSHGQLYVALSRVRSFESLQILLPEGATSTMNHVYVEILNNTHRNNPRVVRQPLNDPEGHYHADDADDVIDAGNPEPSIYVQDPESDTDPDHESDDERVPAHRMHIPRPDLLDQPPAPPSIVLDPLLAFDSLPLEERMHLHNHLMAHLHSQPVPAATTTRTSPPHRRPPPPTRKNPHRAARRDD